MCYAIPLSLRVDYLPLRELIAPLQDFFHQETQLRPNPLTSLQHTNEIILLLLSGVGRAACEQPVLPELPRAPSVR